MDSLNSLTMTEASSTERWSRFRSRVITRRSNGQLCLLPMVLTGFPNRGLSDVYVDVLEQCGISLIEIVEPVAGGFAATTNTTIRDAHKTALAYARRADGPAVAARFSGTLKVIYAGNVSDSPDAVRPDRVDALLQQEVGTYSIFQLALTPLQIGDLAESSPVPMTTMVSATDSDNALERAARQARWMVVCKCADATGGVLHDFARIRDVFSAIRSVSTIPIFATFGISDRHAVERLRALPECDGAIVGTVLVKSLAAGLPAVRSVLEELCRAAFE
jgi:tryptophan synthase alpha subunit